MNKFFEEKDKGFTLYKGDVLTDLNKLNNKFDMIFADPPYFLSGNGSTIRGKRVVPVYKGNWDTKRSEEEIDEFNLTWLSACKDLLKEDGTIWVCGTFHNIFSVYRCLNKLGYKFLNVITWQKTDPPPSLSGTRFNFSSEFIIWAAKNEKSRYFLNFELMKKINGGKQMSDVWQLPSVAYWEKRNGHHPTQKPLGLLYRIILACTKEGDYILDPFAGSCTTGIATTILNRKFIGIDQNNDFLELGIKRLKELDSSYRKELIFTKMSENPMKDMVLLNHCKKEKRLLMIEKGICYLRAGDCKGSLLVTPGFENMKYVLLHTKGEDSQIFKIKNPGSFQIWTKETLEKYGFSPQNAPYYIIIQFFNQPLNLKINPKLKILIQSYRSYLISLSNFIE